MNIFFLIGMPGVGKTYLAKRLAIKYNLQFIDLDAFIEDKEKMKISELFFTKGEDDFREIESCRLKELVNELSENTIVACGGGTPCFNNNIDLMKRAGTVVYLKSGLKWLMNNLENNSNRPLLQNIDNQNSEMNTVRAKLEELLQNRSVFYQQAHFILSVESFSLCNFDEIIESCIEKR